MAIHGNCTSPSGIPWELICPTSQLSPRIQVVAGLLHSIGKLLGRQIDDLPGPLGDLGRFSSLSERRGPFGYRELMELPWCSHQKAANWGKNPKCQLLVVPSPSFEGLHSHFIWLLPCFCTLYLLVLPPFFLAFPPPAPPPQAQRSRPSWPAPGTRWCRSPRRPRRRCSSAPPCHLAALECTGHW